MCSAVLSAQRDADTRPGRRIGVIPIALPDFYDGSRIAGHQ